MKASEGLRNIHPLLVIIKIADPNLALNSTNGQIDELIKCDFNFWTTFATTTITITHYPQYL